MEVREHAALLRLAAMRRGVPDVQANDGPSRTACMTPICGVSLVSPCMAHNRVWNEAHVRYATSDMCSRSYTYGSVECPIVSNIDGSAQKFKCRSPTFCERALLFCSQQSIYSAMRSVKPPLYTT